MDPLDREVLALRHFEHLTNAEAAEVLGIKEAAAGKRYLRLERLRAILVQIPEVGTVTSTPGRLDLPVRDGGDERPMRSDSDADPLVATGRGVRRAVPPRRAALPDRVHRPVPGAGRADPQAVPRHGRDRGARLGRRAGDRTCARGRPVGPRRRGSWATTASSARSAAAAWASSTRPSRTRWAGTWP